MKGIIEDARLITCILPKGRGRIVQEALAEEEGIHTATGHGARGSGRFSMLSAGSLGAQPEKDVLEVCVPADRARALFEKMYFVGEMDQPHGGIIFMTRLRRGMAMTLPELEPED